MTIVEVQEFLESHTWTFAKTMPESPHWYIIRSETLDFNSGALAEAFYKEISENIKQEVLKRLPDDFLKVLINFTNRYKST